MPKFLVIYSKGIAQLRGGSVDFEKQPGRHQLEVVAPDRLSALAKAHEHFAKLGLRVSVERDSNGENKLGFSTPQMDSLQQQGVLLTADQVTGIRVESIVPAL